MFVIDWRQVAVLTAHPTQIAILEKLAGAAEGSPNGIFMLLEADYQKALKKFRRAQERGKHEPDAEPEDVLGPPPSLGTVSYHMRMLRGRGQIVCTRTEPVRGALAHYYALSDAIVEQTRRAA